jgi:hypothetical protein
MLPNDNFWVQSMDNQTTFISALTNKGDWRRTCKHRVWGSGTQKIAIVERSSGQAIRS